jgi:alpha-beta hydrolase superfamily lysophospholipase
MRGSDYWKLHYVLGGNAAEIERRLTHSSFRSANRLWRMLALHASPEAPSVLVSPGSAGHAYVFAELAFAICRRGFNVFVMPKHGSASVTELVARHIDAARHIAESYRGSIGLFGEGLGGYVAFYVALSESPVRSVACENSPAILTDPEFHAAMMAGVGAARRRRRLLPALKLLGRAFPRLPVPIPLYLNFKEMIDSKEPAHSIEARIVDAYSKDPDFDRRYALSHVLSLLSTPPPRALEQLKIPTMFIVANRGITPAYIRGLFERLPVAQKQLLEVDGSVFWMVSHAEQAAGALGDWFAKTLVSSAIP